MEKTVIYFDERGYTRLNSEVKKTCADANKLLEAYKEFGFGNILTIEEAQELLSDPLVYFDAAMFGKFQPVGEPPMPSKFAELYGVKREEYISKINGKIPRKSKCNTCNEIEELNNYDLDSRFAQHCKFLEFDRIFIVNRSIIEAERESFSVFADEMQQKKLEFLEAFVNSINRLLKSGIINTTLLQQFAKFGFSYNYNENKLQLPADTSMLISKLNYLWN